MKKIIYLMVAVAVVISGGVIGYTTYIPIQAAANTRYAAGYSVAAWQQVQPGMELTQVKQLLGEPLDAQTDPGGSVYLYYGRQKNNTNYYIKAVVISEDKIVQQVIDNLIVD